MLVYIVLCVIRDVQSNPLRVVHILLKEQVLTLNQLQFEKQNSITFVCRVTRCISRIQQHRKKFLKNKTSFQHILLEYFLIFKKKMFILWKYKVVF